MFDLPVLNAPAQASLYAPSDVATQDQAARKLYVETYGCHMNASDSEIVKGVMHSTAMPMTGKPDDADVILLNTCAIRDNAEKNSRAPEAL